MLDARETELAAILHPSIWTELGDRVFFSASLLDTQDVWAVPISPETLKAHGSPVRLTAGTGFDADPMVVGRGRLIFSGHALNIDLYCLPLDANEGKVAGEMVRLTQGLGADIHPALSADGTKLVFASKRSGSFDIFMKDLTSGEDTALTSEPGWEQRPLITPDDAGIFVAKDKLVLTLGEMTGNVWSARLREER